MISSPFRYAIIVLSFYNAPQPQPSCPWLNIPPSEQEAKRTREQVTDCWAPEIRLEALCFFGLNLLVERKRPPIRVATCISGFSVTNQDTHRQIVQEIFCGHACTGMDKVFTRHRVFIQTLARR